MSLKFHEIANANHQIINPFTDDQLMLLGDICGLQSGMQQLDLCCGKAEMLGRWSAQYGIQGVGVDISKVFLEAARQRIAELEVTSRITLIEADAATYHYPEHEYDIVSCIGATWLGNGLAGTIDLIQQALRDKDSLLLIGEPFWIENPPDEAYQALTDGDRDMFVTLPKTLDRFEAAGFELIEMVLADHQGWDRYTAMEWNAVSDWLLAHPDDQDAPELRKWITDQQRTYLTYGRRYFGWGVFVLRQI
jgi:SAM-dependent methyltransferase